MEYSLGSRLKHAWNAFVNKDPTSHFNYSVGQSYTRRPDRSEEWLNEWYI